MHLKTGRKLRLTACFAGILGGLAQAMLGLVISGRTSANVDVYIAIALTITVRTGESSQSFTIGSCVHPTRLTVVDFKGLKISFSELHCQLLSAWKIQRPSQDSHRECYPLTANTSITAYIHMIILAVNCYSQG